MLHNLVAGLQEVLQQEQVLKENTTVIEATVNHVANAVQNTHNIWPISYNKYKK